MITSRHNPKIKEAKKLWKRKERDETDLFLIEGYRELKRAIDAQIVIERLFICPELFLGSNEETLIDQVLDVFVCSKTVFETLSYRDRPDGLIAVARQEHPSWEIFQKKENGFYIVAESIEKPGNLGTILRSSDAAGVDGLIVCDKCTDIYNPNVVRASVGTLFSVPVVETTSVEALRFLQENQVAILAATPSASQDYTAVDLKGSVAIVVGTEQYGLSSLWMEQAGLQVKIPMNGVADSLNVATATALLLYEVVRQRSV